LSITYPTTIKVDSIDTYFGHQVADPYRWLENDQSPETKAWVEAQNNVTNTYLQKIPFRENIKKRLQSVWSYTRQTAPIKKGDNQFYYRNNGTQNHSVLYVKNIIDSTERVLIDPNTFSDDGTISLGSISISKDGKYVAYAISKGGSDWREVYVKEVETGVDLPDQLNWVKFSDFSWDKDGFYYNRYEAPAEGSELSQTNTNQKVYYHTLNTSQNKDLLVHQDAEFPEHNFGVEVDETGDYLLLSTSQSTKGNTLAIQNKSSKSQWTLADNDFLTSSEYITTVDGQFWVLTNYDASRYRVMAINPTAPELVNWIEVIPEESDLLKEVSVSRDFIVAHYMVDVQSKLKVFDKKGKFLFDIKTPESGGVSSLEANGKDNQIYFTFNSYTVPEQVLSFNLENQTLQTEFVPKVDFASDDYETKLIFVEAQDGAQVPMTIVHKKGLQLNGNNPTLLYGYGGFNVIYPPRFDPRLVPWLENGGIYVNAHIRGGGEYGDGWYTSGIKMNKQRVFDDFVLVAEKLIEKGYTNSEKLAIFGGSNGGLLVGAVANQRPDLFKVVLPAVGVMDMLRYQYFTIGWAWAGDYGRSDDSEEMFNYLHAYSPLHNIPTTNKFPAVLVTTGDHDDRVVPAHSFKYIATLQEKYTGSNPLLIRIETKAGHGAGKPISMQIDEVADRWAFVLFNMGETYN
jgi:prolyl oligopeptidase